MSSEPTLDKHQPPQLIGPFSDSTDKFVLTCDGKRLPYVLALKLREAHETEYKLWVELDGRIVFGPFTEAEINAFTPLLANAMAFSAGYPCFGVDKKRNEFNCGMIGIGTVDTARPGLSIVQPEEK